VEKPKIGFPLSHPAHATTMTVLPVNSKTKERKLAAARPPHSPTPISCSSFNWKMLLNQFINVAVAGAIR
jgi:hypothetical protein